MAILDWWLVLVVACWLLGWCFVGWLLLVVFGCFALLVGLYLCPCIVHALELGSGPGSASNGAVETGAAALLRTIGFLAQWPLACRIRHDHQMSPCSCSPWSTVTGVLGCTVATVCFFAVVVAASVCIVGCKLLPLHCDLFSDGGC